MKHLMFIMGILLLSVSISLAAGPKSYQVTGPVLEVKDDVIVVQKGQDKWEVAKDKDTKITGDLKVGSKATIMYKMKADSVEVKDAGKKAAEPKKANEPKKAGQKK
jgi:hypothetical protein